jgi:hypothetical protein
MIAVPKGTAYQYVRKDEIHFDPIIRFLPISHAIALLQNAGTAGLPNIRVPVVVSN